MGRNGQNNKKRIARVLRKAGYLNKSKTSLSQKNQPSFITNAGRDLIIDVLHHAASGGSVPVSEKHFDTASGTHISLHKNSPITPKETLQHLFEALGFPRDLVLQYIEDLIESSEMPSFLNITELMSEDGVYQPFLVNCCFDLFDCMISFLREDACTGKSSGENTGDILRDEIETLRELFGDSLVSLKVPCDTNSEDYEIVFNFLTEDEQPILVGIRIPAEYPAEPPLILLQFRKGHSNTLSVYPFCTKDLPAAARRTTMDTAIEVINGLQESACLLPLVSTVRDAIGSIVLQVPAFPSTASPISESVLNSQNEHKKREAFLSALIKEKKTVSDNNSGENSVEVSMAEKIQMRTIERSTVVGEKRRTEFLVENPGLNISLKKTWEKLRVNGSLRKFRNELPAYRTRTELKNTLRSHNVVVISGETGSGKTTQIPQYVYEFMCEDGKGSSANIVCTQPRRLAATSVAFRVAEERDESVGNLVGYSIRLENCISKYTQITYCTTGVLFRRMQADNFLGSVSHVLVDEIHERSVHSDFLLILLRDLLTKRNDLKVILMSATMDSDLFSQYFGGAPIISIKGRAYPVEVMHLEEIIPAVQYNLEDGLPYAKVSGKRETKKCNTRKNILNIDMEEVEEDLKQLELQKELSKKVNASTSTLQTISRMNFDLIDYELIEHILRHIEFTIRIDGAVLIFLPGMAEIQSCLEQLQSDERLRRVCIFYSLHSSLPSSEQQGVFRRPPPGKRKVILGTNIMETSITIDDAVFVIDTGKVKENRYNAQKSLSELVSVNISKANCRQRQGRAGRVRQGFCFRLFTVEQFESFADHQLCEMHRVPLENLVLQIYALHLGNEVEYLQKALTPPEEKAVHSSVKVLTTLGALTIEKRLTSLGQHLANLPLDVRVGKMIIHSALLQCLDPVLTIAACLAARSPFNSSMDIRHVVEAIRRAFAGEHASDHLSSWYAYRRWVSTLIHDGARAARNVCTEFYLSSTILTQIQLTKKQYETYLYEAGFLDDDSRPNRKLSNGKFIYPPFVTLDNHVYEAGGEKFNTNSSSVQCILACLVAGLYPNVAFLNRKNEKSSHKKSSPAFFTTFDGSQCLIHPSSVIGKEHNFPSQLVVYIDKIKTSSTFLREVSFVSPLQVIFFCGGRLKYLPTQNKLCLDELTAFYCDRKDAELLKQLKDHLDSALTIKINDPLKSWDSISSVVMRAIVRLLKDAGSSMRGITIVDRHQPQTPKKETHVPPEETHYPSEAITVPGDQSVKTKKSCFICGETGHVSRCCPHNTSHQKNGPPVRCFICGQWHFPQDCTFALPLKN
ncbi:unnamed protein product [Phytomonas sp. Hart1]|nr:unnamed protein product [Phytomonas sp. Hart1]|eukprot:CCW69558.1 unnamed protein product [Phytomonas sp. isolate Hart1]